MHPALASIPVNSPCPAHAHAALRYRSTDYARHVWGVGFVTVLHLGAFWLLLSGTAQEGLKLLKKPMQAVVIQEVIIPPLPPLAAPPKARVPAQVPTQAAPMERPLLFVPQAEVVTQPAAAAPIAATPMPPPAPLSVAPPPAPAAPVENTQSQIQSLEHAYISQVRAMLNSTKRYPTGRQASQQRPQGRVKLWFTLTRHGALVDVGILESSDSHLLDDAALATVRRGSFAPFPPNTWVGQEQHQFSTEIAFSPPGA